MRSRSESGFTLLEVLVGLVLLSAFVGGIYTVAVGTMVAKRAIEQSAAVYTAGPAILDLVEKDLRAAYFRGVKDFDGFKAQRESVGGKDVTILDLVTTTDSKVAFDVEDRQVQSDVTEVGYRLKTNDEHPELLEIYRREQAFFDDDLLRGGQYHLVYERVLSFTIDFFEAPDSGSSTSSSLADEDGVESWDAKDKQLLPQAARITLVLGTPPELKAPGTPDDTEYTFVRWVLLPGAFDKNPTADDEEAPEDGG